MARRTHLLDLDVLAELTRPAGNRRVFTLFQARQAGCALAAPVVFALQRGIEQMLESARKRALVVFASELLASGMPVLAFDGDAARWLARESARRARLGREWSLLEGQLAAIAGAQELTLVTRNAAYAGTPGLKLEDWFRP